MATDYIPSAEAMERWREAVDRVIKYMRVNLTRADLTLPEMAREAQCSPFHFCRIFRAVTGTAPRLYLQRLRIEEAKRLLEATDMRVIEICHHLGYSSVGTFSLLFHRIAGVPPSVYRHNVRLASASP